ncbi:DAL7 [Cyberlindnera jadinii]|uniref:DAL7 protein n=1 Tax=Cyberlindnera jadinii (strain ATCC 18201 / CBS 1600 / BCRC 20928 / JCM 3617 / NBRC 0987 / NRRL Y-1542) TaxID=983966 RepID=A0A0H5C5I3_CYBJN|nr:DAL7 [Cyberlindnera jadinii]
MDPVKSQSPSSVSMTKEQGIVKEGALPEVVLDKPDDAAIFLAEHDGKYEPLTPEEEKKAIRKTDWILLPCLFWTATWGAVDKVSLSTAAIFGLRTDLNLHGQQYSWLSSILFIGSLVGMWPMSIMVQKFRTGKVLACAAVGWSALTLLQCSCHNFAGLASLRFLMGFLECVIVPGCSLMISVFYKRSESPHRTALVFAFGSSIINGALSALASTFGSAIPTWKYIYLLVGSISFVWSCCMVWFLPDSPINSKWLSDREKVFMVKRMASNKTGVSSNDFKWDQVREAFMDPRTYIVMLFNFGINIPNGGLSTFNAIIIKNLKFTSVQASLMGMPTGVIASLAAFGFTWLAARWNNKRCLVAIISLVVPLIGAVICYASPQSNTGAQLAGLYMMYFYFSSYVVMISLVQANTAGNTKKAVTYGFNYLGYAGGAITGTQTFRTKDAPKYSVGFASMMVGYCACMALSALYWVICILMNKKKEKKMEAAGEVEDQLQLDGLEDEEVADLTDYKQCHFKYTT